MNLPCSLLASLALLSSCAPPSAPVSYHDDLIEGPTPGSIVTLQFRRDALGAAAQLPVSPTTNGINGAQVSITGQLVTIAEDWIALELKGKRHWVPRETVLMLVEENG